MSKGVKAGLGIRNKGKRGELEAAKWLEELGFSGAQRTSQSRGKPKPGAPGSPDIECAELPNLHMEVKFWRRYTPPALMAALQQARRDSLGGASCVIWRTTNGTQKYRTWRVSWLMRSGRVSTADSNNSAVQALLMLNTES